MKLNPIEKSTRINIETSNSDIGNICLWVPEAICTNTGNSASYPVGTWQGTSQELRQVIPAEQAYGPGNCFRINRNTFERAGIRIPCDNPVQWETNVIAEDQHVKFTIHLKNVGNTLMRKAAGAICLKFLKASWWSDETVFTPIDGQPVSLQQLSRNAGRPNGFQAYLLKNQTYDQIFFREYWGFNECRIDRALLVSENTEARICVGIQSNFAYFMHSNMGNPCTDMMLAFGDIAPGESAVASGMIWIRNGLARELIEKDGQ